MPRDKRRTILEQDRGVAMVLGLDLQDRGRRQVAEINAPFNLRLDNLVIDLIAEVGMRHEKGSMSHWRPIRDSIPCWGDVPKVTLG